MKILKRYFTPLHIIFFLEVIVVALASSGFIPREAILVWTGLAVFYMIFSPVRDSLWLFIASIPLFAALPITEGFDTMANWRILIAVLFLCLYFKQGLSLNFVKNNEGKWRVKENLKHYALEYSALVFLTVSALSILAANYKTLAVKKLIFLLSIFLLFLIVRNVARSKEEILRVWRAAAVGGIAVIAIALVQFIAVLFVPLAIFWHFWDRNVVNFFYGRNLADLLSYSNTWFAYYNSAPPTLRLFSVFPDSHSFAMYSLLLLAVFLPLAVFCGRKKRLRAFYRILAGLALFGVVFSGSRGAWISVLPAAAAAFYFWFKRYDDDSVKRVLWSLFIFIAIFAGSVAYPLLFYKIQSWQTGHISSTSVSFFERAKSISDPEETSNKGRLEIWRDSLISLKQRPFLGVGLGNFVSVVGEQESAAKKGASAHNLYLDVAAEIGVAGALILILMFFDILWTTWLVWRKASEPYFKLFAFVFGFCSIWILGYSLFDVVLLNDKVLLSFMVVAAGLYNLRNMIYDQETIH